MPSAVPSLLRRPAAIVLTAVLAFILASCASGGQGGGKTEIVVWNGYTDQEATNFTALIDRYNAQQSKVHVTQLVSNNDLVLQKILTAVRGGTPPDVAYMYGSWSANIAKIAKVVDLADRVREPGWDWDDFYPAERAVATIGNKVIGVPALVDNIALVYNKTLFAQAGVAPPTPNWSWDDFRSAALKLTDPSQGRYGFSFPADASEDTVWHWLPMLWGAGGDILNGDQTKAAFDSAAGVRSLTTLQQMANTDHSVYVDTTNATGNKLMNSGKIGMITTAPWNIAVFADIDYGVQIMPAYTDTPYGHQTASGPDNWVVFDNGDERKQAAVDFLKWITAADQVRSTSLATGDLPTRISVGNDEKTIAELNRKLPGSQVFVENLVNVKKSRPQVEQYPAISEALGQAIVSVLLGKAEVASALADAAAASNDALAKK